MQLNLSYQSPADYVLFLKIKALPVYKFVGRTAHFPDEYADRLGLDIPPQPQLGYVPASFLFDYQRDIAALAIRKERFAAFVSPGYGKTGIGAEFARHVLSVLPADKKVLWLSPLMVVKQTTTELERFYKGSNTPEVIKSNGLQKWLDGNSSRFGITNFEALQDDIDNSAIGAIIVDESSIMKDVYGKYGNCIIRIGKGVRWKLCLTGTPAPNDRIEYANHAVFLDRFPTQNAFYAKYFVNRGMTGERWEMKPHAVQPFYRDMADWCIFMSNPSVYGWKDNTDTIPPTHIHIEDVPLTDEQATEVMKETNSLFPEARGIASRGRLARIAKGFVGKDGEKVETNKPAFIKALVDSWPTESTIIWCKYNAEQEQMEQLFPGCASISGDTPQEEREELIADFQCGRRKVLVSKAKILGLGLNLQVCTRMIFSTCQDSFEEFFQCVKRANRVGSKYPLHIYIPVTDVERPMMENVFAKAKVMESDVRQQEELFKKQGYKFN